MNLIPHWSFCCFLLFWMMICCTGTLFLISTVMFYSCRVFVLSCFFRCCLFVCELRSPGLTCGSLRLLTFSSSQWDSWPSFFPQLSSREWHESGGFFTLEDFIYFLKVWWMIHSLHFFFLFFKKMKISLHAPIPPLGPGLVHSGSVSWDDCGWAHFPDCFLHYTWTM